MRPLPAVLAVLVIAALCPLVPTDSLPIANGSLVALPDNFGPRLINNAGQIAGSYYEGPGDSGIAVWDDGNLERFPMTGFPNIVDFNDAGEILVTADNGLSIVSDAGIQALPRPEVGGTTQFMRTGFGPDDNGRTIGTHNWVRETETNAVAYQGASPPSLITQLATVLAANHAGQIFGQLPGETVAFAFLDGATLTPAGIGGFPIPIDFSDGGYLLNQTYDNATWTYQLWHQGASTTISEGFPRAVNSEGVVALQRTGTTDTASLAALRLADGSISTIRELVGGAVGWPTINQILDINDSCEAIGIGQKVDTDGVTKGTSYLAKVDGCEPVSIDGDFFRVDGGSAFVKIGDDADVRLRVENASSQELTGVTVTSAEVVTETGAEAEAAGAAELTGSPILTSTTLDASGPGSIAFADFTLKGTEVGPVTLRAEVSAIKDGQAVTGTIEREFTVRQDDLVVNLELDPPEYEEAEDGTFEPVDITATVSFTNATSEDMTDLRLQELDVARVFSGQQLYVTYKEGIRPDPIGPAIIVPLLPAGQTSEEFTAVFTATDDGEVEFSALATAANGPNGNVAGLAKERWKAKVRKFVEIKTTVENPPDGELLNAGSPVVINGTIENLTNNFDIKLGPLYPTLTGNTGTMNVGYDGPAANPTAPVATPPMELEPGQTRTFQVRFRTNYSDPRMFGAEPSGGTRAYATFEPWGEAVERLAPNAEGEPERVDIRTYDEASPGDGSQPGDEPDAQVKADPTDVFKRISIDDSIELPDRNVAAVAAGIMLGAAEGLVNAAIAAVTSIPDLLKLPYTILVAAYEYQSKVWESFTEEEKELFLTETSFLIVSVLQRNVEFGLRDGEELYNEVYRMAGEHLTKTQNDWQTGDYLATTQGYSAFLSEQIGSVAGPVILSKMAQSPKAVAALERLQTAINTRMAATFASARGLRYVDNVLPILQSIENGAEPALDVIRKLWGVTPEEVAEYQRICGIIGCIATIRSRHASSVEWIQKFKALLKPENLKIKTVNELDVMLGYSFDDLGSVVFRKPEILKTLGANPTKAQIKAAAKEFAASKGFSADSKEFLEAVTRLEDRAKEWNKYEKTYKQWNDRGWIDTTFNYEGNAIPSDLTGGQRGSYKGFRMVERSPGSDEFVVQMLDGNTGKWRRITGDIDPVDFTYTDGSPLSPEDHARLIQLLQDSPIGAEHGYTSTFLGFKDPETGAVIVQPGPELVKKQFKPNEPALQITANAPPRAARIDVENSRWVDPYDYNIRWINGYVDAGTKRARGSAPDVDVDIDVVPLDAPPQIALPVRTNPPEPTVGRFIIQYGNQGDTAALIIGENGLLQTLLPDGTTQDSPLHEQAFSEGPIETITVAPSSALVDPTAPQPAPLIVSDGGSGGESVSTVNALRETAGVAARAMAMESASLTAGSTVINVATEPGLAGAERGFEVGQQIAIGVGTDRMEVRGIVAVGDGTLTLDAPLEFDHQAGDVVVMVVSATGVPVDPTKGVDPPAPEPEPDPEPPVTDTGAPPSPGAGAPPAQPGCPTAPVVVTEENREAAGIAWFVCRMHMAGGPFQGQIFFVLLPRGYFPCPEPPERRYYQVGNEFGGWLLQNHCGYIPTIAPTWFGPWFAWDPPPRNWLWDLIWADSRTTFQPF